MARVYNEFIDVNIAGSARVKQYSGVGPLMVKLPGERGEYKAFTGDYICYDSDVDVVVGVVAGPYLDAMREDKDDLETPEVPTGAHLEVAMLDNAGAALANTTILLGQGDVPIAEGRSDEGGVVYFNVLPGTYQVRPKDKTLGPEQTVEAVVDDGSDELPPAREGVTVSKRRRFLKPDNSLPGGRFDIMGKPDPHGSYDERGNALAVQQPRA